jgi:hypothetical protein
MAVPRKGVPMARLIAKLVVLIAVLMMPLGMSAAPAAAHHGASAAMPMKHCPEQAPSHHSKAGFVECTMACSAALPAVDFPQERHVLVASAPAEPTAAHMLHGLHPDTATPPPKAS